MLPEYLHEPPNFVEDAEAAIKEHEEDEKLNEPLGLCFLAVEDVDENLNVDFVVCHVSVFL